MNNYHCNEDKDALNRFADKSKMTRQHRNKQRTPSGNLEPRPFDKNRHCVGILNLVRKIPACRKQSGEQI